MAARPREPAAAADKSFPARAAPGSAYRALIAGTTLLSGFITFWAAMAVGASEWIKKNVPEAWESVRTYAPAITQWMKENEWLTGAPGFEANLILLVLSVIILMIAYLLGNVDSILNGSSLSAFYSSRLRAAYLGATTNMQRWERVPKAAGAQPPPRKDTRDKPVAAASRTSARLLRARSSMRTTRTTKSRSQPISTSPSWRRFT